MRRLTAVAFAALLSLGLSPTPYAAVPGAAGHGAATSQANNDVGTTIAANKANVVVGDMITVTVEVVNNDPAGPFQANNHSTQVTTPAGFTYNSHNCAFCSAFNVGALTASFISIPGGTTEQFTITFDVVAGGVDGNFVATITAADEPDPNAANDQATVPVAYDGGLEDRDVAVDKTVSAPLDGVFPGSLISYTILVREEEQQVTELVSILDRLPDGVTYVSHVFGSGQPTDTYDPVTGVWKTQLDGPGTGVNTTNGLTITVRVDKDRNGATIVNDASLLDIPDIYVDTNAQNNQSSASITVGEQLSPLRFEKEFTDDPVMPGGNVTLEFTISNPNDTALMDIAFTDDLDAALQGLVAAGVPGTPCGGSSTIGGSSTLVFSGGELARGASCTFAVDLQVPDDAPFGDFPNTTSILTTPAVNSAPATATLSVEPSADTFLFSKEFTDDPAAPGDTATLEFTIQNTGPNAVDGLGFTDDLGAFLSGLTASGNPQEPCGPGSSLAGDSLLVFADGSLAAGETCTFSVELEVPASAPAGDHTNTTSDLSRGSAVLAGPAIDTFVIPQAGPSPQDDYFRLHQFDMSLSGDVSENDQFGGPGATYTLVSGPSGEPGGVSDASFGRVEMKDDGSFTFFPSSAQGGTVHFVYKVVSANGMSATAEVEIEIAGCVPSGGATFTIDLAAAQSGDPVRIELPSAGGIATIQFSSEGANCPFGIATGSRFLIDANPGLSSDPSTVGRGNFSFDVVVPENLGGEPRTAKIRALAPDTEGTDDLPTVVLEKLFIEQEAGTCTYGLNPTTLSYPDDGGRGAVRVETQPKCGWFATVEAGQRDGEQSETQAWVTLENSSGIGSGRVRYAVAATDSQALRRGKIHVEGKTHNVVQKGGPQPAPIATPVAILAVRG